MPLYAYRCAAGGSAGSICPDFEVRLSMGSAPASLPCPDCGAPARRRFTAPNLSHASSSAYRLIESTERSASEPDVVRSPGPGTRPAGRNTTNPLHRKLPRPD
ncbi:MULTISPECIES: FmdB family zinc ribbon protein [Arthrobacter]|uniref:Zinc ribbon domain-containing protein n=1 Tax=Arthrobacter jinronghuae TaxID=2964609 RepID=A0ABT1NU98_9MICC|nr:MULTISPECIES: FmdB family zinc ribbon protein [Arthrobacter]MCQ1951306.1 zinc ribbon domain-containing protein [Arthrobacter jinronghuae]MCQ1954528.1 zinc ribbon domain-containing protein [Arthrobacter sp. zg-Y238]MCQ1957823.1 zinc ribbon domain-containing protein [Arthrobacter jinronghuae]UWX78923.1 zinc ribbon domain-containing protein [Arthrobacter jinronghuae]